MVTKEKTIEIYQGDYKLKFGFIYDACAQISFYMKDGMSYDYQTNKPYTHIHAVSPSLHMAGWNYPFLWEDSCFLNLSEWVNQGKEFPDEDFDVILYANERPGLDPDTKDLYKTDRLRERYPNAKIYAWFKEVHLPNRHGRQEKREQNRIEWLEEFGDLEKLIANAGRLKPKRFCSLVYEQMELLRLNRKLIRLQDEIEFEMGEGNPINMDLLKEILLEMEMTNSWEEAKRRYG